MHDTAQAFGRTMEVGATKSVSFEKKLNSVRFKISLQKVLKIKKITRVDLHFSPYFVAG